MKKQWLINADVGEGHDDSMVMPYLDCASIACGGHSGDEASMRTALKLAKKYSALPGAHLGYPDKENFGRVSMSFSNKELLRCVANQIKALTAIADKQEYSIEYVKIQGALNHDMLHSKEVLRSVCTAIANTNTKPSLVVPTNTGQSWQQEIASSFNIDIWWEVFADRAYEANGLLRSIVHEDALYHTPEQIIAQIEEITKDETITTINGQKLSVGYGKTICIHGDHQPSVTAIEQWYKKHNSA